MAYSRLEEIKRLGEEAKTAEYRFGQVNPVAEKLGIQSPPLRTIFLKINNNLKTKIKIKISSFFR